MVSILKIEWAFLGKPKLRNSQLIWIMQTLKAVYVLCRFDNKVSFFVIVIHLELFPLYEQLLHNWSTEVKEQSLFLR